ncbi:MAG: Tetratricopeptide repeat, partial [candidate division NC10 bacterium]|nr:Tetratricopeptide repeat [candidate division NC10 bacterium]
VDEAIAIGRTAIWPRFSISNVGAVAGHNMPFLKDVLARAYWQKGDLESAAAEYRKLTTITPDSQLRYLIHPLYHYRLGRVLEEKGDRGPARTEYRTFLEHWKDADPGHPELADARNRLAAQG